MPLHLMVLASNIPRLVKASKGGKGIFYPC